VAELLGHPLRGTASTRSLDQRATPSLSYRVELLAPLDDVIDSCPRLSAIHAHEAGTDGRPPWRVLSMLQDGSGDLSFDRLHRPGALQGLYYPLVGLDDRCKTVSFASTMSAFSLRINFSLVMYLTPMTTAYSIPIAIATGKMHLMANLSDFLLLKHEIEQIGREMRSLAVLPAPAQAEIGVRLAKALEKFEFLAKTEAYEVMAKDAPEPERVIEDEIPDQVLAKRAGYPGTCSDCGNEPCICFAHLPRPRLTIRPDRMIKVEFDERFTDTDKLAWLRGMRMALIKRRVK
jgi:hypothetical protein